MTVTQVVFSNICKLTITNKSIFSFSSYRIHHLSVYMNCYSLLYTYSNETTIADLHLVRGPVSCECPSEGYSL